MCGQRKYNCENRVSILYSENLVPQKFLHIWYLNYNKRYILQQFAYDLCTINRYLQRYIIMWLVIIMLSASSLRFT